MVDPAPGTPAGQGVKPAPFDYVRAETAEEAVSVLAEHGEEARVLAGGQSLMAILNMRLARPRLLVDISRCQELAVLRRNGALTVGAAVTQAHLERSPRLAEHSPLLAQALPHIAHFQIRSRGTVCGSIAHADPSAELPLALVALRGRVTLRSKKGWREVAGEAFITGMLSTARRADELLESVSFPLVQPGERQGFAEFARRHGDFALVALAASVTRERIRLAVGGVEDRPRALEWPRLEASALDDALNSLAWSLEARDDPHASAALRRHLVRRLGRRLITELCQ